MRVRSLALGTAALFAAGFAAPAHGTPFSFTTGDPDGRIATASRPGPAGPDVNQETGTADDFVTTAPSTTINAATFTGLLPSRLGLASVSQVRVEIYRLFPNDSTSPPSGDVPTRANSPADTAFLARDSADANLTFGALIVSPSFTASNSVDFGIHPSPNQTTGGDGSATGQEVQFSVAFATPIVLPADHYFFVPQVLLSDPDDHFLWLSAPGDTVFAPDLQSWIRNDALAPDWLRVGTDIVGGTTFNAAFSLAGVASGSDDVDEPFDLSLLAGGLLGVGLLRRRSAA
jgi:hypothetical protein